MNRPDGRRWLRQAKQAAMARLAPAPSDAVVLFDGNDISKWEGVKNPKGPFPWKMGEGYFETVKDAGYIRTKQKFGSCQLHVEFATPEKVMGNSQGRGNSGVFLMEMYEIQVLDNYNNQHLRGWSVRGALWPQCAACQRLPKARRMAVIRHRLPQADVQGRQGGQESEIYRISKRRSHSG